LRRRIDPITDPSVWIGLGVVATVGVVVSMVRFVRATTVPQPTLEIVVPATDDPWAA
jgi:hypothetical protein